MTEETALARQGTKGAIFTAMPKVMAEVKAVAKTKRNVSQNYSFRGFDDVYAAVRDIMAKHGVFATHSISEHRWEERTTSKGNSMYWVCAVFDVTFWASDGSSVVTQSFGEAMDSGDKAANKAMSMAMKYALVDTFLIPTGEERDTETDHTETTKSRPMGQSPRAPASGYTIPFGKHKGKAFSEIPANYLTWMVSDKADKVDQSWKDEAAKEIARRAKAESEPVDAEVVETPGDPDAWRLEAEQT